MRIQLKIKQPFAFAGLWGRWKSPDGDSCSIITSTPNDLMRKIYDRMPLIFSPADYVWLEPSMQDKDFLQSLLFPYPANEM
ncbi:SOS response-associated peptidase family protein [Aneurinibacillus sp. Ricciae_BoGa-3]|uniref:SOS response-associated peptidase family protein n=1 Tax=Aneurinibacillus sp. Ricciae_BoGa-3 TaxID=3022697 RepID=UPI003FA44B15